MYAITWIKSIYRNVKCIMLYNVLFGAWISSSFSNTKVRYLKYELYFRHPLLLLLDINRSTIEYSDDTVDSSQYS